MKLSRRPTVAGSSARFVALVAFVILSAHASWAQETEFRRGDTNNDSVVDISDAVFTLGTLFGGSDKTTCNNAIDANDDELADLSDAIYTLNFLFTGGDPLPPPNAVCGPDPTPGSLGCDAYGSCRVLTGLTEFETPIAGDAGQGPEILLDAPRDAESAPTPAAPMPTRDGEDSAPEREIEESDIYKVVGSTLYVLNRWRGLQIIDLSNPDDPKLIGHARIFGYPREMYVRGTTAYVIVSDYFTFWRDSDEVVPRGFYGSQLRILDISDPTSPVVVGGIDLQGDLSDSRIVGDVMYLVSRRYPWYRGFDTTDTEDKTQVLSVTVSNPASVRVIDFEDFPRDGWEHHIHVNSDAVFLSATGYDRDTRRYQSNIRYIDISDPAGNIRVRGQTDVPGRVMDRWSMNAHNGVLRVASGETWGNGDVFLRTFSLANPDAIRPLGSFTLHIDERLTAARFFGDRGVLVTYRDIDPVFTFDLSDPSNPRLLGELKLSGWIDHIVPLGKKIVALGHDDRVDPETGRREINLAVSLIDVSTGGDPVLESRVGLDGVFGWVPGDRDDVEKVFKVLPAQNLILFPFFAWSRIDYRYVGGVQLIDLNPDALMRRGLIKNGGFVERGIPYDTETVLTLSNETFQVVDITNRDDPQLRSSLELARNVQSFAILPTPDGSTETYAVQLSGNWHIGDTKLTVTTLDDPDTVEPAAQFVLPAPYGRMFVNGSLVYVASVHDVLAEDGSHTGARETRVDVVDFSDPLNPVQRGSVALPEEVSVGYHSWHWFSGDEVVQVNGSTLAFHRFQSFYYDCLACGFAEDVVSPRPGDDPTHRIYVVDLSSPDDPVLGETIEIEDVDWAWGLKGRDSTLYLSAYQSFVKADGSWYARYHLYRFDVSNPANVLHYPPVNTPGVFVDASSNGEIIYTLENRWDRTLEQTRNYLYALRLEGPFATLESRVELRGYVNSILVKGDAAFGTTYWWETIDENGATRWVNHSSLVAIDLSSPQDIRITAEVEVPYNYSYLQEVEAGWAFIGSGAGLFIYEISDLYEPTFEKFSRTQGWVQDVVYHHGNSYLPTGVYGVQVLTLGGTP
ncbi:MAG: beta-propeller domain-containing protein [Planctomycetes bacterium]|nr:beta-propeller domain-containing protein [Planctomycetota bacterium]